MDKDFLEWLNDEIEHLEAVKGNNNMIWAKYSEAIRIRQVLLNLMEKDN